MARTRKLNGKTLSYPLAAWQMAVVMDEALRLSDELPESYGMLVSRVAEELTDRFLHCDLVADHILAANNTVGWEAAFQSRLDSGRFDALQLKAIIEEAKLSALSKRAKVAAGSKNSAARAWVVLKWSERSAGQFKTRDEFASWCIAEYPQAITTAHERVRDKWIPAGPASEAGRAAVNR